MGLSVKWLLKEDIQTGKENIFIVNVNLCLIFIIRFQFS